MRSWVVKTGFLMVTAALLGGCGQSSAPKPNPNQVFQVTLSVSSPSLVAGEVVQLTFGATNSAGTTVTTTFTFNSTNTSVATVSPGGLVCGGVWDSTFVVCNGNDAHGNPIVGTATITVSAAGVTSAPIQIAVHPVVTSIVVEGPPANTCFSVKQTFTFKAHACSSQVQPPDATGFCAPNAKEITSSVGGISWTENNSAVAALDTNGVATASAPGLTGVIASVGTVTSPATNFRSCLPVSIVLHLNGDPPGMPTEAQSLAVAGTSTIEADMTDENGVTTNSAPVSILLNNFLIGSISGTTLTASTSGGSGLLAACVPPTCGVGLNIPIYSNLFSLTVTGTSPTTMIYATSSSQAPGSATILPIDNSKNPPAAIATVALPGTPNSLVFAPNGAKAYMGTTAGLAALDTTVTPNTVTLLDPTVGKVLAVSPDSSILIVSNAAIDPATGQPIEPVGANQRLVIFNVSNNTVQRFVLPGAVAAAFTGDGFKAFIAADCSHNTPASTPCPGLSAGANGYVFSPSLSLQTIDVASPGGNNIDVATLASGPFGYYVNGASPSTTDIVPVGTCNNTPQPSLHSLTTPAINSTNIQMVKAPLNANLIVAVDSPTPPAAVPAGIDIVTATVGGSLTPPITTANCAPPVTYSNQFIDFGIGAFTARKLIVPSNGTGGTNGSHIVVLPAGTPNILVATPGGAGAVIHLTGSGATEALSGDLTLDGNTAWVGVAGSNTVDEITLTSNTDTLPIATSFTKSDGTAAPPDLVAIKPK